MRRLSTRILGALAATLALAAIAPALTSAAGSASSAAPGIAGGWGAQPMSYIGSYRLLPIGQATAPAAAVAPSPPAGLFSLAVHAAAQLGASAGPISSGRLVTFLRKVKTGEPLAPSGILSIFGASGTQVLYLTDLAVRGDRRSATVNGGSFLGVPVGSLTATVGRGGLDAVIRASGLGTVRVRLTHFRAAPPSS